MVFDIANKTVGNATLVKWQEPRDYLYTETGITVCPPPSAEGHIIEFSHLCHVMKTEPSS